MKRSRMEPGLLRTARRIPRVPVAREADEAAFDLRSFVLVGGLVIAIAIEIATIRMMF